jgi:DNA-binding MarR family transcriptional regulator
MESSAETASVLDSLRRIFRALRLDAAEARQSLGPAQLFVLRALGESPAASIRDLAARTLTDPSSASVVVERLVARKLVARRRSSEDARRFELSLTAPGRAVLAKSPLPPQVRLIDAIERLGSARRRRLARSLVELVRELGTAEGSAGMFFEPRRAGRRR